MENQLFNLKVQIVNEFTAKQLERQAKKSTKEEAQDKAKLKKAIQQGNVEGARIYAANAIRHKNESLNLIRLASRIDATAARVQTAVTMKKVSQNMKGVVNGMEKAMKSMNLEQVMITYQISMVMDKFEQQFEDLDVQTEYMENSMGQTTALTTPADQVDDLIQKVADENGLELNMALPNTADTNMVAAATEKDELGERLARLRG